MLYSIPRPVRWVVCILLAAALFSIGFSAFNKSKGDGGNGTPTTQSKVSLDIHISPQVVPYPDHLLSPPIDPYFQDNNGLYLWGHTHNDVVETSTSKNDYVGYKQSNGYYEYSVDDLCLDVGSNGVNVYPESCVANDQNEEFEETEAGNVFNAATEKCIEGGGNNVAVVMTGSAFFCPDNAYTVWSQIS